MASRLPAQAQVIVSSEMDTDCEFDNKLVLNEPYKLLKDDEYVDIERLLEPMRKAMYEAMQQESESD